MSATNRKSLGAVRFDPSVGDTSPSKTSSPNRRRRSFAAIKKVEITIEENDDEAERLARRGNIDTGSPSNADRRQSSFGLSAISNLSASEMNNQIAQCIKLSAENKINDKNAFQLKMIDFLVYTLKKQDPKMTNLQMASASLDASAKIYGFRVDKVHSDLLKIIGMAKLDKKDSQNENVENDENQLDGNGNECLPKKKKRKNRQNILSSVDALKGLIELYDPLSLIRCQRDTQTSDMLFQAGMPQHANQGVLINLFNDVIFDRVEKINHKSKTNVLLVDNYKNEFISPSYEAFNFLEWTPDDELNDKSMNENNDGEYHFDLDAAVTDDRDNGFDDMMDCDDVYEERCERLANNHVENIIDFQDIIANNPNPNATYEYSYLQKNYRIHWAGPSHWKITVNKNLGGSKVMETCKHNAAKKKKEMELSYTAESKEDANLKFGQINRQSKLLMRTTRLIWSEDKVTFPQNTYYELKHYYHFFNKPTEYLIPEHIRKGKETVDVADDDVNHTDFHSNSDSHDFVNNDGEHYGDMLDDGGHNLDNNFSNTQAMTQTQSAFVGDNLVSIPRLTDKIFIPYSQRAKKIDMRQLKKVMWKNLKNNPKDTEKENLNISQSKENEAIEKSIQPKSFSSMYTEIPKMLSKINVDSLSPSIAFVSLLHLANEKSLELNRCPDLSDLSIKGT